MLTLYPSDVSDEEWTCMAPYLVLLPEDAGRSLLTPRLQLRATRRDGGGLHFLVFACLVLQQFAQVTSRHEQTLESVGVSRSQSYVFPFQWVLSCSAHCPSRYGTPTRIPVPVSRQRRARGRAAEGF
jgi:hypothetical protein